MRKRVVRMNKSLAVAKVYCKTQLIWRFDLAFKVIFTITKILFAYVLWSTIFENQAEIGGFTFGGMLSYYVIQSFLSNLDASRSVSEDMNNQIRGGTFSKYMILPINIQRYYVSKTLGSLVTYFFLSIVATLMWVIIFQVPLLLTGEIKLILGAVLLFMGSAYFMIQFHYFIGLLAFIFQNIWLFIMIESNLMSFISGGIIPLVLLPSAVVEVIKLLPFYYSSYLPTMLLMGRNDEELGKGIVIVALWIMAFKFINHYLYQRLRVRYDGVGI